MNSKVTRGLRTRHAALRKPTLVPDKAVFGLTAPY